MRSSVAILVLAACTNETPISPIPDPPGGDATLPEAVTDVVVQPPDGVVDVLFVIDDSGSMGDDQQALAEAFPQLVAWFEIEDLDYHVGVVSTDLYRNGPGGVLRSAGDARWIDRDTPDPVATFQQLATVGTSGADSERGLGAAYLALGIRADDENAGFLRQSASLHTIVVSDEDDDTPDTIIEPEAFVAWYDELKDQPDRRTFSSIVETDGTRRGSTYLAVTGALGGASADLQESWLVVLDRLGLLIAEPMDEYFLSRQPIPGSLEVRLEIAGKPFPLEPEAWALDETRNAVTLVDRELEPGTRVVLDYLAR